MNPRGVPEKNVRISERNKLLKEFWEASMEGSSEEFFENSFTVETILEAFLEKFLE